MAPGLGRGARQQVADRPVSHALRSGRGWPFLPKINGKEGAAPSTLWAGQVRWPDGNRPCDGLRPALRARQASRAATETRDGCIRGAAAQMTCTLQPRTAGKAAGHLRSILEWNGQSCSEVGLGCHKLNTPELCFASTGDCHHSSARGWPGGAGPGRPGRRQVGEHSRRSVADPADK